MSDGYKIVRTEEYEEDKMLNLVRRMSDDDLDDYFYIDCFARK